MVGKLSLEQSCLKVPLDLYQMETGKSELNEMVGNICAEYD